MRSGPPTIEQLTALSTETARGRRFLWRATALYLKSKYEVALADLNDEMKPEILSLAAARRLSRRDFEKLLPDLMERFATWKLASAARDLIPAFLYERYTITKVPPSAIFDNQSLLMATVGLPAAGKAQGISFLDGELRSLLASSVLDVGCLIGYMMAADDEGWAEDHSDESLRESSEVIAGISHGKRVEDLPSSPEVTRIEGVRHGSFWREHRAVVAKTLEQRGAQAGLDKLTTETTRLVSQELRSLPVLEESRSMMAALMQIPTNYKTKLYHLYFLNPGTVIGYLTALVDDGMAPY